MTFDLAALPSSRSARTRRATALSRARLSNGATTSPALRTLEAICVRGRREPARLGACRGGGEELKDVRARLGALWDLAFLQEWKLPASDPSSTYA